ncbi:hypothetical protein HK102_003499 [Quaeritorhiza haematococci]|nr:hypothetical protein HK102_003499 [Quaeritorhiza haematococci]
MVGKRSEGFADNLDKNRDLLAFNNRVYNLKKRAFRAAEPEDYLTITVSYDFEAKRDAVVEATIHDFLDKVFPNPEVKKYTLKFLASTLAGHTSDQLFHFGHGSGSNGKGVLNNLMDLTLGHYAGRMDASFLCSKIKEADAPTPTLTKLVGCRFVYISECVDGSKINEQTFKQLCGEDKLTFRPLHGEQVDFHPDFKLFMVCNNLPKFNGTEYSMRRRLRVIPFVSSFKGQDELVGSASTAKVFLKNPRLNEEIKEWRMSFMHLLLDHYHVYKTETLEPEPATMKAAARTWIRDNDSVARFIEDRCTFGPDEKVHWWRVWTAYLDWKATVPDISNHYSGKQTFFDAIKPKIWNCCGVVKKESLNIGGDPGTGFKLGFGLKDLYL